MLLLVCAAFVLRAVVPVGYMPATAGSGLLFELCPAGIPAEFAQFLASQTGHDHQHADHSGGEQDSHQCDIGHILLSAAAVDDTWQLELAPPVFTLQLSAAYSFASTSRSHYQPRGPPA